MEDFVHQAVPGLCRSGFCWEHPRPQGNRLHDVWAGPSGEFFVGDNGTVIRHVEGTWSLAATGTTADFVLVHGGENTTYFVSANGMVWKWDDVEPRVVEGPSPGDALRLRDVSGIWVPSSSDVLWYSGAASKAYRFDGSRFSAAGPAAFSIVGFGESAFVAGPAGIWAADSFEQPWRTTNVGNAVDRIDGARREDIWGLSSALEVQNGGGQGSVESRLRATNFVSEDAVTGYEIPLSGLVEDPIGVAAISADEMWFGTTRSLIKSDGCEFERSDFGDIARLTSLDKSDVGAVWATGASGAILHRGPGASHWKVMYEASSDVDLHMGWVRGSDQWVFSAAAPTAGRKTPAGWAFENILVDTSSDAVVVSVFGEVKPHVVLRNRTTRLGTILSRSTNGWTEVESPLGTLTGAVEIDGEIVVTSLRTSARRVDGRWTVGVTGSFPFEDVEGIWAADKAEVWAVSTDGAAVSDGNNWRVVSADRSFSIGGTSRQDVWVGGASVFRHWDGAEWRAFPAPVGIVRSIQAVSSTEAYAVVVSDSGGSFVRWDGESWTVVDGLSNRLLGLVGDDARILMFGEDGHIVARDP